MKENISGHQWSPYIEKRGKETEIFEIFVYICYMNRMMRQKTNRRWNERR